jgi:hypothetical protein
VIELRGYLVAPIFFRAAPNTRDDGMTISGRNYHQVSTANKSQAWSFFGTHRSTALAVLARLEVELATSWLGFCANHSHSKVIKSYTSFAVTLRARISHYHLLLRLLSELASQLHSVQRLLQSCLLVPSAKSRCRLHRPLYWFEVALLLDPTFHIHQARVDFL